jgi:hypothetical protein
MLNAAGISVSYAPAANIDHKPMTISLHRPQIGTIEMESLSLSSYVRLCTMISICLGLAVSVLFFILDVLFLSTNVQWGMVSFAENEMGLIVLFVGPFVFAVTGFVGSLLSYKLFLWALRAYWGIELAGTWKEPENSKKAIHIQQTS